MSQAPLNIADGTGSAVLAEINNALLNLATLCSGSTDPSTLTGGVQPLSLWMDTTSTTNVLKQRNAANTGWNTLLTVNQSTGATNLVNLDAVQTLTNKTLTAPVIDKISTSVPNTSLGAGNSSIMKNRIINGAMVIDQRNAGASINNDTSGSQYCLDRWNIYGTQSAKFSAQQSSTAPAGFTNSLKITSLSAYSSLATDQFVLAQPIEGFNVADLGFGTANAKTITVGFWVQSSLIGTFGGSLTNSNATRCYPFSFTISSANTPEFKTVTVAGDTTGTWLTTNGVGLRLTFNLGSGSNLLGTAGSWGSTYYAGVTGNQSIVGTSGATLYATGIQLEVGSSATGFEYRMYGQELALCQRYYENNYGVGYAVGSASAYDGNGGLHIQGYQTGSAQKAIGQDYKVTKRDKPTITFYDVAGNSGKLSALDTGGTPTNNISVGYAYINQVRVVAGYTGTAAGLTVFWTASAEL